MDASNVYGVLADLAELERKWERKRAELFIERMHVPRWRWWKRMMLDARIRGIDEGLLNLSITRLERMDPSGRVTELMRETRLS